MGRIERKSLEGETGVPVFLDFTDPVEVQTSVGPEYISTRHEDALYEAIREEFDYPRTFDGLFDPYRCPRSVLPYLAAMRGTGECFTMLLGEDTARELVDNGWYFSQWRGVALSLDRLSDITNTIYTIDIDSNTPELTHRDPQGRVIRISVYITPPAGLPITRSYTEYITRAYRSLLPIVPFYNVGLLVSESPAQIYIAFDGTSYNIVNLGG